jgi:hypothetical protein
VRISGAGLRESHVHDVTITRESPNYPSREVSRDAGAIRFLKKHLYHLTHTAFSAVWFHHLDAIANGTLWHRCNTRV